MCGTDAQAAGHAAAEAAHRPTNAGGSGLNVAAASFLPHAYTDEHRAAAAAFRQFAELYRQHMALPLSAAAALATRLSAATEGGRVGMLGHHGWGCTVHRSGLLDWAAG